MSCRRELWAVLERMQGEIAAQIRVLLGESAIPQAVFDQEQRNRRIDALMRISCDDAPDEERHELWMQMHRELGWVYGEQFDTEKKTHPNMRPWSELPDSVRVKAKIFDLVAKAGRDLEGVAVTFAATLSKHSAN